jgi:exodeoxyribonuclease V beta subunit
MEFRLPTRRLSQKNILELYQRHRRFPEALELEKLAPFEFSGFLSGFMDMIFSYEELFYIIDWKSNHLGTALADYSKPTLATVVLNRKYFFQADLYTAALSRHLRQRQGHYCYNQHFGGTMNVFLRAMDFPGADPGTGIVYHKPDENFIKELEDLIWG